MKYLPFGSATNTPSPTSLTRGTWAITSLKKCRTIGNSWEICASIPRGQSLTPDLTVRQEDLSTGTMPVRSPLSTWSFPLSCIRTLRPNARRPGSTIALSTQLSFATRHRPRDPFSTQLTRRLRNAQLTPPRPKPPTPPPPSSNTSRPSPCLSRSSFASAGKATLTLMTLSLFAPPAFAPASSSALALARTTTRRIRSTLREHVRTTTSSFSSATLSGCTSTKVSP